MQTSFSPKIPLLLFLATPHSVQNLSSLTRDETHAPCSGRMQF